MTHRGTEKRRPLALEPWADQIEATLWGLVVWLGAVDAECHAACVRVLERRYAGPPAPETEDDD